MGKLAIKHAVSEKKDLNSVIKQMVFVKNISKLLNEKDKFGRTALHLAAEMNSADMIHELKDLDPEATDNQSMTPLHVAAIKPSLSGLKAMIDVFYGLERTKKTDIDHGNRFGDSVLHICCDDGNVSKVRLLVAAGANLEHRGKCGFTLLHRLVKVFVKAASQSDSIIDIYREVVNSSVKWKCSMDKMVVPKEDSEMYNSLKRDTMRHLLCELPLKRLNVLQYAAKKNATKLLDEMLQTPYVFTNPIKEVFEVTHLFPDTCPQPLTEYDDDEPNIQRNQNMVKPMSCLELVVNSKNLERAEETLAIYPFNELMHGYWSRCQHIYNFLLGAHVLFMSLFTAYVMPTSDFIRRRFNLAPGPTEIVSAELDAEAESLRVETSSFYGLFLIWPAIIVVLEFIAGFEYACRTYTDFVASQKKQQRKRRRSSKNFDEDVDEELESKCKWRRIRDNVSHMFKIGKILLHGFQYLSHVVPLVFCSAVLAWYIMYLNGTNHHQYCECLAVIFIFGWLHTISYIKVFKSLHAFTTTFKHIVAKDVTKFAYIFVFVLISFSFAIHALSMSLYPPVSMHSRTLAETIYLTFCLTVTVTVGGLLDISTELDYERAGGNIQLLHIVFAGYICTSTIILLNMLIAMMNSTYSAISSSRPTDWRIESLRTALWFERNLPCLQRSVFVRFKVTKTHDYDQPRWYIKITPEQGMESLSSTSDAEEVDTSVTYLQDVKAQLTQLQRDFSKSNDTRETTQLKEQMTRMEAELRKTNEQMDNILKQLVSMNKPCICKKS